MNMHFRRLLFVTAACGLLGACGIEDWFTPAQTAKLPGKRITILSHTKTLEVESATQGDITVPPPERLTEWPQEGGYPSHSMQNKALSDKAERICRCSWVKAAISAAPSSASRSSPPTRSMRSTACLC